ncbi:MAG TPA: hypothetical protein VKH82_13300 [Candidatus Binatia bacterium]|nr:hypothetical protein [Candidatus Binatia bacterium]
MSSTRSLVIAVAVAAVLWLALDSGRLSAEPAQPGTSAALGMLALVFGVGAFVMRAGGQQQRVPLLVGMALGTGAYALVHACAY